MTDRAERRAHTRADTSLECKALRRANARYIVGITRDLSAGGAALTVRSQRPFALGETLDLAISSHPAPIVSAWDLVRARIVRSEPDTADTQSIAVQFDEAQPQLGTI